jgi:hypothetical protein
VNIDSQGSLVALPIAICTLRLEVDFKARGIFVGHFSIRGGNRNAAPPLFATTNGLEYFSLPSESVDRDVTTTRCFIGLRSFNGPGGSVSRW